MVLQPPGPCCTSFFQTDASTTTRPSSSSRPSSAGESAKELNRSLLSALRRAEKKTRLRSQWTAPDGTVERYFDYVLKKVIPGTGE